MERGSVVIDPGKRSGMAGLGSLPCSWEYHFDGWGWGGVGVGIIPNVSRARLRDLHLRSMLRYMFFTCARCYATSLWWCVWVWCEIKVYADIQYLFGFIVGVYQSWSILLVCWMFMWACLARWRPDAQLGGAWRDVGAVRRGLNGFLTTCFIKGSKVKVIRDDVAGVVWRCCVLHFFGFGWRNLGIGTVLLALMDTVLQALSLVILFALCAAAPCVLHCFDHGPRLAQMSFLICAAFCARNYVEMFWRRKPRPFGKPFMTGPACLEVCKIWDRIGFGTFVSMCLSHSLCWALGKNWARESM